ncbi:MAG: PEP-CTERM sorting domain-containing protein [Verrucomicrobiia bacterium]
MLKNQEHAMKQHSLLSIILVLSITTFANAQNLFLSDYSTGNIYEYTPSGTQSTFASGLTDPDALAFDSARDLFEADGSSGNIYEFSPSGTKTTFASVSQWAYGIAFDSAGNLYVANSTQPGFGPNDIIEITPSGTESVFASGPELDSLAYLAFNSVGDLFYDQGPGSAEAVLELTPNGVPIGTYADGLRLQPGAIAFDTAGNLFVTVTDQNLPGHIYEITPSGTVSIFASGVNSFDGLAFQGITLPVPEPSTLAMLGLGALVVFGFGSKRSIKYLILRQSLRPLPLRFPDSRKLSVCCF